MQAGHTAQADKNFYRWIRGHQELIHRINGLGLTLFAAFMLAYWGVLLSLRVLLR